MAEKFRSFLKFLDIPSGSVLGVYTGCIIVMSGYVVWAKSDLPSGVVACYLGVVGAKTSYSVLTKPKEEKKNASEEIIG